MILYTVYLAFYYLPNNLLCKNPYFIQKENGECRERSFEGVKWGKI